MTTLSPDALRILHTIHERGLNTWTSCRRTSRYYGDLFSDDEMPIADWHTLEREIGRMNIFEAPYAFQAGPGCVEYTSITMGRWESDLLTQEEVSIDDDGIHERYTLTDKALALIGGAE